MSKYIPTRSTAVAAAALIWVTSSSSRSKSLAVFKRFSILLLLLNWRALPLFWHIELWGLVPALRLRIRRRGVERTMSIGRSPFRSVTTRGKVTCDAADWNMHMSNSSYARALDKARFSWLLEVVGPAMGQEKVWSPLASTSYTFFKEIPVLAQYEIDVHLVSYDHKWIYYVARFTTAPPPGSSVRTLNCVALSKSCFRIGRSRQNIEPVRVLSVSGTGSDMGNWNRITQLRKEGKGRDWIKHSSAGVGEGEEVVGSTAVVRPKVAGWEIHGLEEFEETRRVNMTDVARFGDVTGWKEL